MTPNADQTVAATFYTGPGGEGTVFPPTVEKIVSAIVKLCCYKQRADVETLVERATPMLKWISQQQVSHFTGDQLCRELRARIFSNRENRSLLQRDFIERITSGLGSRYDDLRRGDAEVRRSVSSD